jgi:hypothetical protein
VPYPLLSRYLLPASFSVTHIEYHFVALKRLEESSHHVLAGTVGIIIGGPLALYIVGSFS